MNLASEQSISEYFVNEEAANTLCYFLRLDAFVTQNINRRTSLVVRWIRICLPMQMIRVQLLVWEGSACHRITKPACPNYRTCALEPANRNYSAQVLQLVSPHA